MRKLFFAIVTIITSLSFSPAHAGGNEGDEFLGRLSDAEVRALTRGQFAERAERGNEVAAFVLGLGVGILVESLDQDRRHYHPPHSRVQTHAKDCAEWLYCGGGRLLRRGDYCPPPYLRYGERNGRWYCVD